MMGSYGVMFWAIYGIVMVAFMAVWLVWVFFSIKFFKKASEYYQTELDGREKKDVQMQDLLAKFDQLVDVLKVK